MTERSGGESPGEQVRDHGDVARSAASGSTHSETVAIEARGIILAGGESRRFTDGDKALVELGGSPFIRRVVSAVTSAHGRPPIVAVNRASQRERVASVLEEQDLTFVCDTDEHQGPIAGVEAAVRNISMPWVFLSGCDMPLISPDAITWLSGYCTTDVDAVVLTAEGHPQPLHSFYLRSSVCDVIDRLPQDAGVRALIEQLPTCRRVSASEAPESVPIAESILNVNTRGELERLRT